MSTEVHTQTYKRLKVQYEQLMRHYVLYNAVPNLWLRGIVRDRRSWKKVVREGVEAGFLSDVVASSEGSIKLSLDYYETITPLAVDLKQKWLALNPYHGLDYGVPASDFTLQQLKWLREFSASYRGDLKWNHEKHPSPHTAPLGTPPPKGTSLETCFITTHELDKFIEDYWFKITVKRCMMASVGKWLEKYGVNNPPVYSCDHPSPLGASVTARLRDPETWREDLEKELIRLLELKNTVIKNVEALMHIQRSIERQGWESFMKEYESAVTKQLRKEQGSA